MATNPARPQYQDTIDEAWGDQVADHVIRRFVDNTARDADFAGFAPADLNGQMIRVGTRFQTHNGTNWIHSPYHDLFQRGEGYVALSGSSTTGIVFPEPFNAVNFSCVVSSMNAWNSPCKILMLARTDGTGVTVTALSEAGTGAGSGQAFGFMWVAAGPAAPVTGPTLDNPDATVGPILYDTEGRPIVREQNPSEQALCARALELGLIPPEGF